MHDMYVNIMTHSLQNLQYRYIEIPIFQIQFHAFTVFHYRAMHAYGVLVKLTTLKHSSNCANVTHSRSSGIIHNLYSNYTTISFCPLLYKCITVCI